MESANEQAVVAGDTPAPAEAGRDLKNCSGPQGAVEVSGRPQGEGEAIRRAKFPALKHEPLQPTLEKIDYLKDVALEASVELGGTVMTVEKILALDLGSVVELSQSVTDPVKVLINGNPYAYGEVVVIGEKFGVRITKIINEG